VQKHHTLSSEKYYVDKLESEARAIQRYQASKTVKTMMSTLVMLSIFAVGGYFLYMTPIVPETIEMMKANGILKN